MAAEAIPAALTVGIHVGEERMRIASRLFAMIFMLAALAGCTQAGMMGPALPPLAGGPPAPAVSSTPGTRGGSPSVRKPAQTAAQAAGMAGTPGAASAGLEGATLAPGAGPAGAQGGGGATPPPGAAAGGMPAAPAGPALEATPTITPTATITPEPSITPTLVHGDVSVLTTAQLVRVIDGTTLAVTVHGQPYEVRYLGIEVPDAMATAATAKNSALVSGQTLYLQKDVTDADAQGRLLRYVYTKTYLVNAQMVWFGFARAAPVPPDTRYADLLAEMEDEAHAAQRGLWAGQ